MKLEEYIKQNDIKAVSVTEETKNDKKYIALALSINGKTTTWRFGVTKAKQFMLNKESFKKSFEDFDVSKGTWTTTFTMPAGKFETKPVKLNANHVAALYLFEDDIDKYIDSNSVRKPREAIKEPKVIEVVDGFETKKLLLLPCFEKTDIDTGDGLIPWTISEKKAKSMVNYMFDGDLETHAEEHLKTNPEAPLVWTGTKLSGETYDVVLKPEMVRCYVTYRKDIERFERSTRQ